MGALRPRNQKRCIQAAVPPPHRTGKLYECWSDGHCAGFSFLSVLFNPTKSCIIRATYPAASILNRDPKWAHGSKTEVYVVSDSAAALSMDDETDFRALMCRVRAGSPDAICELICKYEGYIRRAVRRAMDPRLRSKFDSMDFVQLAWNSFFRVPKHVHRIETCRDFIAYVTTMARNKVLMERRHRRTQKRDSRRELPLGQAGDEAIAREPQPVDTAIALERLEQLVKSQSPLHRRIIELRLQGDTFMEIGTKLDIDLHTAQRFIKRLGRQTPR